jgi:hypothetical protein
VPPIWKVLQQTWRWFGEYDEFQVDEYFDQKPTGERKAWWEYLVGLWNREYGTLSIV